MKRLWVLTIVPILGLGCAGPRRAGPAAAPAALPAPLSVVQAPTRPLAAPRDDVPALPNFAQVSPNLYRGGQPTRAGFAALREMGVRTVVNLRDESDADRELTEGLGLNYVHLPSSAWTIGERRAEAFLRIVNDRANQPVFVHCRRGADRTGFAVAAYRMAAQGWTAAEAKAELPRFHFHAIFFNIPHALDRLDAAGLRERSSPAPVVARSQ